MLGKSLENITIWLIDRKTALLQTNRARQSHEVLGLLSTISTGSRIHPWTFVLNLYYTQVHLRLCPAAERIVMKYDHDRIMKVKRTVEMVNEATVSIEQAIAAVSPIGGTIFEMRLKEVDDRVLWRVKMVRDGERVKVNIDAKSGLIIEAKAEVAVGDGVESHLTV